MFYEFFVIVALGVDTTTNGDSNEPFSPVHVTPPEINQPSTSTRLAPEDVRPLPKAPPRKLASRRRKGQSLVLTDTPIKDDLIAEITQRSAKKQKIVRNVFEAPQEKQKAQEESSDDNSSDNLSYAESADSYNLDLSDCEIDFSKIAIGDYVLVTEGKKVKKYSVGEIVNDYVTDYEIRYYKRMTPLFKFIKTDEVYTFNKQSVVYKLPPPTPSGGTQRRAEMLIFSVDLTKFRNVLI